MKGSDLDLDLESIDLWALGGLFWINWCINKWRWFYIY